ncbi:unnamed protein product, partial [marine sediment metagenome]
MKKLIFFGFLVLLTLTLSLVNAFANEWEMPTIIPTKDTVDSTKVPDGSISGSDLINPLRLPDHAVYMKYSIPDSIGVLNFMNLGVGDIAGIDMSASGLGGVDDYYFYLGTLRSWRANGTLYTESVLVNSVSNRASPLDLTLYNGTNKNVIIGNDLDSSLLVGDKTSIGSVTDGESNATATVTDDAGAAHGISLAAGDLAHITDSTTEADEGFYQVISDDGTNIVLDRTLTGTAT